MTDDEYHEVADQDMDRLHEGLEDLTENFSKDWEVEYSVSAHHHLRSCFRTEYGWHDLALFAVSSSLHRATQSWTSEAPLTIISLVS